MSDKQKALAAIEGLTFADCFTFFDGRATERDREISSLFEGDDEHECDGAIISEGDDNGAFLLTWTWISFAGTPLDKGAEDEEP
jgi:hypothetical protein